MLTHKKPGLTPGFFMVGMSNAFTAKLRNRTIKKLPEAAFLYSESSAVLAKNHDRQRTHPGPSDKHHNNG
ncbi:hypothetical protein LG204_07625 [Methylovorus menthalis]|uniref:hypothetical protein n=1 Tax=Methylovorus menthalis TaxID=1002227 RepID=UPI001E312130|nr:hypothetical protein [Methylovorus menthalis]MCB4811180.1 hypothetical protein [Methylovorus menthalis]